MRDPLAVYLSDHFAGSRAAIDLLGFLRDQHRGEPLANFAADMLVEIRADRDVLDDLVRQLGARRIAVLKEGLAVVGEKVTRLKLRRHSSGGLGTFLALESLALGVLGKCALWRALSAVATQDGRLNSPDYDRLITRALEQHAKIEEQRLRQAPVSLRNPESRQ